MTEAQLLVVDDEVGMVTLLRNYLTREGYEVTTAPSAEVALQILAEHDIDVVLTDLRMPGMFISVSTTSISCSSSICRATSALGAVVTAYPSRVR